MTVFLCVLLSSAPVSHAQYDKTAAMQERADLSHEANIRTLLGVEQTPATSIIGKFLKVLDVSEAIEKFSQGEYNDGAAVLAKLAVTSLSGVANIIAAAIDVGTVCRDSLVNMVFGPQIQTFYDTYHTGRMDDLKTLLDQKKLSFNGEDFMGWANDSAGEVANTNNRTDVKFLVDDKVIGSSGNKGLYNIAQMKIQDQQHSTRSWYIKLIGRVAPSKVPVSPEAARDYWLQAWNKKVVVDGMEYVVRKKKQYIETYTKNSEIRCVANVTNPVDGFTYGLRCPALRMDAKQQPVMGIEKLEVTFIELIDFETFMKVTRNSSNKGAIRFELLGPDGRVVQAKDVKFADMLSTAGGKRYEDETGIWHDYRVQIDFDWKIPSVGSVGIALPSGAKIETLNISMGVAKVRLATTGTSTGIPGQAGSGTFSLGQWVSGESFDVLAVLGQMQFDPASYLLPSRGQAYPSFSAEGRYTLQETQGDTTVERRMTLRVNADVLTEENSFTLSAEPVTHYHGKKEDELKAIYEGLVSDFISNPGDYPKDLLEFRARLPRKPSSSDYNITQMANEKLKSGLLGVFENVTSEVAELRKKYDTRSRGGVFWNEKRIVFYKLRRTIDALCFSRPAPILRESIVSKIDEYMAEAEAMREVVKSDRVFTEKLVATVRRDIVPRIRVQRNLIILSSTRDLSRKISTTLAELKGMLADQDATLDNIDRVVAEPLTSLAHFDMQVADLQKQAMAGAFYGKRVETLQAEAQALTDMIDTLAEAPIRQQDTIRLLGELLQTFNAWASEERYRVGRMPRSGLFPLDTLHEQITGSEPTSPGETWAPIDTVVTEILAEIYRVTREEIELFDRSELLQKHAHKILRDAFRSSGKHGLSPIIALYASHLSSDDLTFFPHGGLHSNVFDPVRRRASEIQKKWRESLTVQVDRPANNQSGYLAILSGDIEKFIDLCNMSSPSEGDTSVQVWRSTQSRIQANINRLATVGQAGMGKLVSQGCSDIDKLGQIVHSPELAKASWQARYIIMREVNGPKTHLLGERYASALTTAMVRLLDVADKSFHSRLSKALKLPKDARDKELQALNQKISQGYWSAVGIGPLSHTQFGRVLHIHAGSRSPGSFEVVHSKWSEVVTGWMAALEK